MFHEENKLEYGEKEERRKRRNKSNERQGGCCGPENDEQITRERLADRRENDYKTNSRKTLDKQRRRK